MSRPPFRTQQEIDRDQRQETLARLQHQQLVEDIRGALEDPRVRRLLWQFVQTMGLDDSPYRPEPSDQARAIGRMEAGQWWLRAIRDNCPEREAQMRAEANRSQKQLQAQLKATEETDDE
jgi:hypothetical protein